MEASYWRRCVKNTSSFVVRNQSHLYELLSRLPLLLCPFILYGLIVVIRVDKIFFFPFRKLGVFWSWVVTKYEERPPSFTHTCPTCVFQCLGLHVSSLLVEFWASSILQPRLCDRLLGLQLILRRKHSFFSLWQWAWHSHVCIQYHLAGFIPNGETLPNEHFLLLCK